MSTNEQSERVTLGQRIKETRDYLGFSQDEVGEVLGISRSAVSLMESGQRKTDALELQRLAKLFERPISFFTGEDLAMESRNVAILARMAGKLEPSDLEELRKFAEYLEARAQAKGKGKNG
ncbi:helix-turn-helix domain-containing protein [Solimonas terrae]|uniref:Helix-turn-helix transcriptional regulator n=1 Tax=Solimonas terrae TaxID=1396819 RepID=A0A6M2BSJ9_9GAMM|nr:helix-turn-helix transcriptional regulator [Solimonas terrae]NGY05612.1 helix-turn-helix transcriptional regulator [Solimonas terrae]